MKTLKTKLALGALLIALTGAGLSNANASDELYRPDKQTGRQISQEDCLQPSNETCGLLYHEGENQPFDVVTGEYVGN